MFVLKSKHDAKMNKTINDEAIRYDGEEVVVNFPNTGARITLIMNQGRPFVKVENIALCSSVLYSMNENDSFLRFVTYKTYGQNS